MAYVAVMVGVCAVPTIVLSSTGAARGETPASRAEAARLQEEIVADFPAARQVRVAASGHYIQHDQPEVVVNAARELAGCVPAQRLVTAGRWIVQKRRRR